MAAANPVDMEVFSPLLKEVYLPIRKKLFPSMHPLIAAARKGGPERVRYTGSDLRFDVKVGRRGGFVSSALGYFPVSKIAREKQGRLGIARSYAQVALDGLALRATTSSKGAYLSVAKKATEDLMEQYKHEQNRIMHGDSLGVRAQFQADPGTGTSWVVDSPYGIASAGPGNLHLEIGDDIAAVDASDFSVHTKAQITGISLSGDNATLTVDTAAAAAIAVNDHIVTAVPTATHATDSSFAAEPHGLKSIVDVENAFATFEGINDPRWVAYKTTSASVDETTLMSALNTIRNRSGEDWMQNPEQMMILTTTGIWQAYGESLLGLRRFSAPEMELKGGFKGVKVGDAVLLQDPWCPRGRLYMIHTPSLIFVDLMDFGELSYQDSPKWSLSTTQDIFTASFGTYWNFGTTKRLANGVISGITDATNYSPVF
jgi:hypothetical protein